MSYHRGDGGLGMILGFGTMSEYVGAWVERGGEAEGTEWSKGRTEIIISTKELLAQRYLWCIEEFLANFIPSDRCDKWKSKLSVDGQFYVHDVRHLIDQKITMEKNIPIVWNNLVPFKVGCFIWRAGIDRISSSFALVKRGINVHNRGSHFCSHCVEDTDHLLVNCIFAKEVLDWMF
ncbi:hypothetical protein LXL04_013939 [Taraxacum kok-saghyz]